MTQRSDSSPDASRLVSKYKSREATVAVIGLGYVGLPMVRAWHDSGMRVIGYDIDASKIESLKEGEAYLKHLGEEWLKELAKSKRFTPTCDPRDLKAADAFVICVPTPLGRHREPDLTYVERSTELVAGALHPGALVVLTSTSFPGTTRDVSLPILERTGLRCGRDFYLAFSPEREDPGRPGVSTRTITRLLGGIDETSTRVAEALLSAAVDRVVLVESAEVAEAAKLLENIYRAVNIALVNELKGVLAVMGIDIWRVIEAAATKPFGFHPFYPGPGLGGHCIPIDPFYLTWKAHEFGCPTRLIELAGEINHAMPAYVVERLAGALNDDGKALRGADVLVIGLAYKPDIDDVRETPAAEIITLLIDRGARVSYHDPHVPVFPSMRNYDVSLRSEDLTPERLGKTDAVVVVTHHAKVDWKLVARASRLVVDTRNALAAVPADDRRARIVKA